MAGESESRLYALLDEGLPARLDLLVRVRWILLAALALAVLLGALVHPGEFPASQLAAVGAAVAYYNLLFTLFHRWLRYHPVADPSAGRIEAALQIGLDLVALSFLVHLTGGIESPLLLLDPVHAVGMGLLLPRRDGLCLAAAAWLLALAVALLEARGALPHRALGGLMAAGREADPGRLVTAAGALAAAVFGAVALTSACAREARARARALLDTERRLDERAAALEATEGILREKGPAAPAEGPGVAGPELLALARELNDPAQFVRGNVAVLAEAFSDALPLLDAAHAGQPSLRIARLDYPFFKKQLPVLLHDLAEGTVRIASLVKDLEARAHRDEGRADGVVDLNEAVHASLRLARGPLGQLEVEEDLDPHLPRLRGNPRALEQALVNTLCGAAKALGPEGRGHILVRTRAEEGARRVRLSIAGDRPAAAAGTARAPGVAPESANAAPLAPEVTYGIVRDHQGRIEVETRLGEGTTFHYLWPALPSATAAAS